MWWHCGNPNESCDDSGELTAVGIGKAIDEAAEKAVASSPDDGRPYDLEIWITADSDDSGERLHEMIVTVTR